MEWIQTAPGFGGPGCSAPLAPVHSDCFREGHTAQSGSVISILGDLGVAPASSRFLPGVLVGWGLCRLKGRVRLPEGKASQEMEKDGLLPTLFGCRIPTVAHLRDFIRMSRYRPLADTDRALGYFRCKTSRT